MKGIGDKIWNTLIEKSSVKRDGWNGDCGIVDGMNDLFIERVTFYKNIQVTLDNIKRG